MVNWRKPVIETLLALSGNDLMKRFRYIRELSRKTPEQIKQIQRKRLEKLLVYSYRNVPYYHKALGEAGLVDHNGNVNMENWRNAPFLTKDILRAEFHNLQSKAIPRKRCYENTSGGSTGEPVKFMQHKDYLIGDMAAHVFFSNFCGKEIGEPELKLWGNQRDVFAGSVGWKTKLQNWLYNRFLLNSFQMESRDMPDFIRKWNKFKPKIVWTYVDSIYELARFVEKDSMEIHSPSVMITTAGTLDPSMRSYLEKIFRTKTLNQYGSREVGGVACECLKQHGLHIFEWKQYLEVVDEQGANCEKGEEGEIVITCLENFAMPLIRFKIGDMGVKGDCDFSCGYNLSVLENVTGRVTDHFIRKDGSLFHGQYFGFLFYYVPWVKKFQFIQKDFDLVKVYIVLAGEKDPEKLKFVEEKIKLVLGEDCRVVFEFVDKIPHSPSGKFLYTISEVYQRLRQELMKNREANR